VIVVDASVLSSVVGDDGSTGELARRRLLGAGDTSAPDLADVETVAVLRKRWLADTLPVRRFQQAVDDLISLPMNRYPTARLMLRAYELRSSVTTHAAAYVALAEALGCTLLTADARLSRAAGISCNVEVLKA
jgi:predicted nucleic acid-binding protein